jgi:hypothetical protein
MDLLKVISPAGIETTEKKGVAPRLPDLSGKKVAEVWNAVFRGNETFPVVRQLLQERFPGIKIVPYTEFPHFPGDDRPAAQREAARVIAGLAKEKGCDALISGNGA